MIVGLGLLRAFLAISHRLRPGRRRVTLVERLEQVPKRGLPLREPVSIYWNEHQVPFIEARHDRDLAVALGVVHGHLRLAQMEMMRRAATGRLSEVVGPLAVDLDHALRVIDLGRAVPQIIDAMPDATRLWMEGFADGINAVIANAKAAGAGRRPDEFALLRIEPEPWTVRDLVTLGRLASTDFTWKVWMRLLRLRRRPDWPAHWQRLMRDAATPVPSYTGAGSPGQEALRGLLDAFGRHGSNSVAVAAGRSTTGSALLASDPHLGIVLPNLWLMAGYRSPSYNVAGLMIPGVPAMALGRNPWIGWGGTNMHAASSELFDVTDVPAGDIVERRERIKVRWWPDREVTIRETAFGPIITDAPLLGVLPGKRLALHWIGHGPSDEITALLGVNRARNWQEFRDALKGFAVPAHNMIYADREGHVGQAMVAVLPRRPHGSPPDLFAARDARCHWERLVTSNDLPARIDPPAGFVASANNRPEVATNVPVGFFFSPDDRVRRLKALLGGPDPVSMDALKALQRDVLVPSALELRDCLLGIAHGNGAGPARDGERHHLVEALRSWDGRYDVESTGAVALELLVYHFARELSGEAGLAVYGASWEPWALLRDDIARTAPDRLARAIEPAIERAAAAATRSGCWGDMHRLQLPHLFAMVPGLARRYTFVDMPSAGSNETVMKTAYGFSDTRHAARLGSNARHITDLADPDANYVALLGGQDGWLGSTTFLDQMALWRSGDYIRLPLRPETARSLYPHHMDLTPPESPLG